MESGKPTVAIGTVFEIASILRVDLFGAGDGMPEMLAGARHRLDLLPARVRQRSLDAVRAGVSAHHAEIDEMMGRYASYPEFADLVWHRFTDPTATLRELFARIVFNICIGNTDDHARNHAAFWDGAHLTLTPAYDLCPQLRSGTEANQAMAIGRTGERQSRLQVARDAAAVYLLDKAGADATIDRIVGTITEQWEAAADTARLTGLERQQLCRRQILDPYVFARD